MADHVVGKVTKNYAPAVFEEEILKFWQGAEIYRKVKTRSEKNEKFYFLDGPPYVTNPPHVGTAWNKILKDVIIRYKRMRGYNVRDQPGYDCHGLPIEVKVEEDLHIKSKKEIETEITVEKFIDRCKTYALENADKQTAIFRDLGIWMDWDNPYMTLEKEYMESVWWTIKKAAEKGLLEKGLKVVHWCPRCETALAGYEVTDEYREVKDHSIYVKFPVENNTSILIWTTTPWTLPANVAVMVHPDEKYVQVESMGEHYILAEKRCEAVFKAKGDDYKIVKRFSGKELEGMKYHSPLRQEVVIQRIPDNPHIVVLSREYVSMSEGTGCVHTAPGHGEEDFEVGKEKSLPAFSPVDGSGRFTEEAGKYRGAHVRDMNLEIIKDIKQNDALFMETLIEHSYPHCWRCKTPLLMRTTEQWFIKISSFKERMIKENSKVYWAPEWAGSKRFADWLKGARDWVISRQRFWGVPLPIWVCDQCGRTQVVGSSSELESKAGLQKPIPDLHRQVIDAIQLKCGCGGTLSRIPDIIDVWLDSGAASWASLGYPIKLEGFKVWWPADAITEAHDQTRGWFYTQLGASVLCFEKAPYKAVLMHGHTLDPVGQKMSKSMGNFIAPEEVVKKFGRDALRLSLLQMTTWEDSRFSWEKIEETYRNLQIVWNVLSFASLYMNLDKFHPPNILLAKIENMRTEDRWLLSRTEKLKADITRALDRFEVHIASRQLIEFAIEDLSHWYIRTVRRRFWQEKDSPDKVAAYTALYYALQTWMHVAAPFIPFFTEKAYREFILPAEPGNLESLHLNKWPSVLQKWVDEKLETMMKDVREVTDAVVSARQALKIKLRQPVGKLLIFTEKEVKRSLQGLEDLLLFISNAKRIEYLNVETAAEIEKLSLSPKYNVIGPVYKRDASRIGEELRRLDGQKVLDMIDAQGFYQLKIGSTTYKITPAMIICKEEMPAGYSKGSFSKGRVYIEAKLSDDLIAEGFVRDIIRRVQEMRRLMDLPVDAYISVVLRCPEPRFKNWLTQNQDFLKEEIRATQLTVLKSGEKISNRDLFKKSWQIEGDNFDIGIRWIREED
ncbi:isoleucine--tRNA ligase [[Eubacterium] cellulosolvens]